MSPLFGYIVETLVTLFAVSALAVVILVSARRAGFGRPLGPIELVGRLPIDARRAVYLVRVGPQVLVLGASEAGLTRLGEVDAGSLGEPHEPPAEGFAEVMARLRGKKEPRDAS